MVTMPDLWRCNRPLSGAEDVHMGSLLSTTGSARVNTQAGGTLSVFSISGELLFPRPVIVSLRPSLPAGNEIGCFVGKKSYLPSRAVIRVSPSRSVHLGVWEFSTCFCRSNGLSFSLALSFCFGFGHCRSHYVD